MKRYQLILATCLVSILSSTSALAQIDQTMIKQIVEIDPSLGFGFNDQFSDIKKKFGAYIVEAYEGYFSFQTEDFPLKVSIVGFYDYKTESFTQDIGRIRFNYSSEDAAEIADLFIDFTNYLNESVRYEEYQGFDFPNYYCYVSGNLDSEESTLTIAMIPKD